MDWLDAAGADLGGLASGALLQYVAPNARGSGIPLVKVAYAGRSGPLRVRDSIAKFFISALQIGTGSRSARGTDGPDLRRDREPGRPPRR